MRIRISTITFMALSLFIGGCGSRGSSPDFGFIDAFLATWDRFAQGANELVPQIKSDTPKFQHELAEALAQDDKRAPSRLVFYAVVQVGTFIPQDSELGRACEQLFHGDVSNFTSKEGERGYFAGD